MPVRIRTRAGRLKREVFFTRPLNHIVVEPLLAALCDPLIAARVMTVEQMERGNMPADGRDVPSVRISLQLIITASFFNIGCAFPELCLHMSSLCLHTSSPLSASQSPSSAR